MSDNIKLIIEIPKDIYERCKEYKLWSYDAETLEGAVAQGTPLDSNSERAEVQAYFAGQAYGWEEGRKALLDDVKAEIEMALAKEGNTDTAKAQALALSWVLELLDNIGKAESEDKE